MSKKPNKPNSPYNVEPFENWFKSFHRLVNDAPIKGFLDSIDDFFRQPMFPQGTFPVSIKEQENKHVVIAELPGVGKEQIEIDIFGDRLSITVNKHDISTEEDDKNKIYRHRESIQQLNRTITLPYQIDEKIVYATYRNGLLKITIPKVKGNTIEINE